MRARTRSGSPTRTAKPDVDDFFIRALLGAVGVALAAGPLGCVVVWQRMAYFGAALSHAALLGVGLGFLLRLEPTLGVLATCVSLAICLALLERYRLLSSDTLLGIIAHAALALGLVVLSLMQPMRIDLLAYLFGDVLAISSADVYWMYALAASALALLALIWRPLLSMTVNPELAAVEGAPVERTRLAFVVMMAIVIAIGMKVVGVLLVVSLLIIPAAAARRFARSPEQMACIAAAIGVLSVVAGLLGSLEWDIPAGPAIVLVATGVFLAGLATGKHVHPSSSHRGR